MIPACAGTANTGPGTGPLHPRRHFWDSRGSGSGLSVPENSDFGSDQGPTRVQVSNCKHRQCWLDHSWYYLGINRPWIKTETKPKVLIGFQLRENWDPRVSNGLCSSSVKVRTMPSGLWVLTAMTTQKYIGRFCWKWERACQGLVNDSRIDFHHAYTNFQ